MNEGREIPEWFTYDEVVRCLRRVHPEPAKQAFLAAARDLDAEMPVILMTGKGSEEVAVKALRAGAASYNAAGEVIGRTRVGSLTNLRALPVTPAVRNLQPGG